MAFTRPGKRPRAQTADEEIVEVVTASSNLKPGSHKRPRLSAASDDDGSESESVSEDSTEASGESDAEYSGYDSDMQEEVNKLHTQIDARHNGQRYTENRPADDSIVEEIKCINFMCHSKLTVPLGPLINFIIGHNGSGKSAVLTALTLCLGGKATATNRGQNLKSFIKEGQDSCTLSVQLKNQGSGAYRPDLYGKSIIVERHFSKTGSSGFKIRNAKGKVISTKKQELEDITDHFALQLDNPVNVLTQDMARQFLNSSTPKDKYKFFFKGTQLEALDQDYKMFQETLEGTEAKREDLEAIIAHHKKELDQANQDLAACEQHATLKRKLDSMRRQMIWSQVIGEEKLLEEKQCQLEQIEEEISQKQHEAELAQARYNDANNMYTQASQAVIDLKDSLRPCEERKEPIKDQFDKNKAELTQLHSQQRQIKGYIEQAKKVIDRLTREIREELERMESANGGQHAAKLNELQDAKLRVEEARHELNEHGPQRRRLEERLKAAQQESDSGLETCKNKQKEIANGERRIQEISKDEGRWTQGYDRALPALLDAINRESGFREKPVGPLGRHIRLLKPEWSSILESSFATVLNNFVVTNKPDSDLLGALMRRTKYHASVIITTKRPIDTTGHEPDPLLVTWLKVLKIDNDLVRNSIIINQQVEQTVLIEDRNEAMLFMGRDGNARPRNVRLCLTMSDDNKNMGFRIGYSGSGQLNSQPIKAWETRNRMQTDRESQLSIARDSVQRLRQDMDVLKARRRDAEIEVKNCNDAIGRHMKEYNRLKIQVQHAEEQVDRLKDELDADTPQQGKLDALQTALKEAEADREMQNNTYGDAVNAKDALGIQQRDLKQQMDEIQEEIDEIQMRISKAESTQSRALEARRVALLANNEAHNLVEEVVKQKQRLQTELNEQQEVVTTFVNQAENVCRRVAIEGNLTHEQLEIKYDRLQKDYQAAQNRLGGTEEEITQRALNAKETYVSAKEQFDSNERVTESLKLTLVNRQARWRRFQELISLNAQTTFTRLLAVRAFRGQIQFAHNRKELDLAVEPDITKASNKGRQTKTLSGGEKSFSTICMLLALWDAMGSPIRCLDEFDVFMDSVNRDISMKMIISAAREAVGRQFIFITPQSMGNITAGDDVKIIKMSDPERGQTALPFTQQS
ncbi:P-loop containing nucleoside triphosphate hydrolase protein [Patellaria atrata CBS 101060]|uniref:P-loop containing nucleoside triphosphate hydrolase protein n=1 Tax=Patellaria atrata CBS 101060 TaxID=1346257 RepID=A0A9P4S9K9_9PEZI|nr:P-loop containing nucleoside triphosphate hydrolase protein [Patellaria atrata CBS 101060]